MAGNGDSGGINRILAGVLGTLAATAVIAIFGFTYAAREDLGEIRLAQASAIAEVRLLSQRIEYLNQEYQELKRRVDEIERSAR